MNILITGITGYVGGDLVPHLLREGHEVRGLARDVRRATLDVPIFQGDVVSGEGLDEALGDVDVAYYLVHSMERSPDGLFFTREQRGAHNFAEAARRAGVGRIVYLGGLVPQDAPISPHLASRLDVERTLMEAVPGSVAMRASIVVAARSRSFRFLVKLVERVPVIPMPPWTRFHTQPIDGRDVREMLVRAATAPDVAGRSLDIAGPDVVTYGEMLECIRDLLLLGRPGIRIPIGANGIASRIAAAIAGEDPELIGPLMGSLGSDLLPRDMAAPELLGVRLHRFDRAVERALRDWEEAEPDSVAAR